MSLYLICIAAWLVFKRWRLGRWVSWGGRELHSGDVLFVLLIIVTLQVVTIASPLGSFNLWIAIPTAAWVIGLCLVYEWHKRRKRRLE